MYGSGTGAVALALTAACTASAVADGIALWCTTATGACSQRPTHGAGITRTPVPSSAGRRRNRSCAPAISQLRPSHTRTVSAGGALTRPSGPSFTMSKWW